MFGTYFLVLVRSTPALNALKLDCNLLRYLAIEAYPGSAVLRHR